MWQESVIWMIEESGLQSLSGYDCIPHPTKFLKFKTMLYFVFVFRKRHRRVDYLATSHPVHASQAVDSPHGLKIRRPQGRYISVLSQLKQTSTKTKGKS